MLRWLDRLLAFVFGRSANARRAVVEEIEPRILYSADVNPLLWAGQDPNATAVVATVDAGSTSEAAQAVDAQQQRRREIIFVDAAVADAQTLIDGLIAARPPGTAIEVVQLQAGSDGVRQIGQVLAGEHGLSAVHIVSHGDDALLQLGSTRLDAEALVQRSGEIANWRNALDDDADLMIYGCDVARGEAGAAYIERLAQLTGADVAASTDATGATALGGNWVLEAQSGQIESQLLLAQQLEQSWNSRLALTPQGGETRVNTITTNTQSTTNYGGGIVAMDSAGNYVVVWNDANTTSGDIYFQRYNASGVAQGSNIRVNTTTANAQTQAKVAMDNSGNFVVVWNSAGQDGSGSGIYGQRYNASGVAQGGEFRVNTTTANNQYLPTVAMSSSGAFVVVWADAAADGSGIGVYAQRYNAAGAAQGSEFRVNTTTAGDQAYASVAMDGTGNFVVVWDSDQTGDFNIYVQRYNASGVAQGGEVLVNTTTAGVQWDTTVAMDFSGNFVVVWESATQDSGGNAGIYAQRFNASGVAQGGEFHVNTTTTDAQTVPVVAMNAGGGFIVAWNSYLQDGSLDGVYTQQYDVSGTALGGEVRVATTATNSQIYPAVAYRGSQAVVAWSGEGSGDASGVFTQRYSVSTPASITVTPVVGLLTTEAGGTAQFNVVLNSAPTATVTITVSSSDTTEGTVSTSLLTFTTANWATPQTITVTGVDDALADGFQSYSIVLAAASSSDAAYNSLNPSDVQVANSDNDITHGQITVDTTADTADGDTSSLAALAANRGADGVISLREAIIAANNTANGAGGADRIHFNIAAPLVSGAHTMSLATALPDITGALVIDGTTEPDFAANGNRPVVVIDGEGLTGNGLTLTFSADGSTVKGLVIRDFTGNGIVINGTSDNHVISGNYIGQFDTTGADAGSGEAITGHGIYGGGSGTRIGGTAASDANLIHATFKGVTFFGAGALNNAVLGNAIYGHSGAGIDLGDDGVTYNDPGDSDAGANGLMNYPVLESATTASGNTLITGKLAGPASTTFRVEFFSSPSGTGDASGYGEARVYLGSATVTTDANGRGVFSQLLSGVSLNSGDIVTATATVDLGGGNYGATSEFAGNILANRANLMLTGSYVGNGVDNRQITGLGFRPEVVIVLPGDGVAAYLRTSAMVGDTSKAMTGTTALQADRIQSIEGDGFTVGTDVAVNTSGQVYHWIAFSAGNDIDVGSYTGTGSTQTISGLGFNPEMVWALPNSAQSVRWETSLSSSTFDFNTNDYGAAGFTGFTADGFTVDGSAPVNGSGTTNYYVAWNQSAGYFRQATYTGNGVDYRNVSGVGFSPDLVFVRQTSGTNFVDVKTASTGASTDATGGFGNFGHTYAGYIRALQSDGFQVSADADENANGLTYAYFAFNQTDATHVVNTVPAAQTTSEDTLLVFHTANGNAIAITDADAGAAANEVTISVTNGSLTLSGTAGLTFVAGDGSSDATMTLRGTAAAINTALNGMVFSPTANYNGGATLTLTTLDATLVSLNIDAALQGRYAFAGNANDTGPGVAQNGALVGNASIVTDATRGQVVNLDGTADAVQIGGVFGSPPNVTLAAWVNLTSIDTAGAEVISLGDNLLLRIEGGTLSGGYYNGSTWIGLYSGVTLAGAGWHHVAYSFDDAGNATSLYLDGALVASASTADSIVWAQGVNTFIGTHGNGSPDFDFNGKIDDARIYDRVLSASEVATLAADLSMTDSDSVAITVAAVNDAPVIASNGGGATASVNVAENQSAVSTVTSTDVDGGAAVYSIAGGADAAHFTIDPSTGVLTFIAAPDHETPTDAGANNVYELTVQVADGAGGFDTQALTVTVTDVANTLVVSTAADNNDSGIAAGAGFTSEWLNANKGADGAISLREAIIAANNTAGTDTISFNITGAGPHTINLLSALPIVGDAVVIDGSTEPDYSGAPVIVLRNGAAVVDGLQLYGAGGSTIRGLAFQNFTGDGIDISGSNGNTIAGNWFGLNTAGTGAAGNSVGINVWNSSNNVIGGSTAADRNVISGNTYLGVVINTDNGTSSGNQIRGNYIGTSASGAAAVGNANQGVWINAAGNTIGGISAGQGNVISGNLGGAGLDLTNLASGTLVAGNLVGLNAAGTAALGNVGGGVFISSANNTVGGITAAARNVISGNTGRGLTLSGAAASGNVVIGNYIGTNISGTADVNGGTATNGLSGVVIDLGATNNRIGTNADGSNDVAERNVISGNNWYGLEFMGSGTSGNLAQGNYIGTDVTGQVALGNTVGGVSFWNGASNNRVGSGVAGAGNVVSGNDTGVLVANGATDNRVQGNLIGLAADGSTALGNSGVGVYFYNGGSAALVSGNVIGTDADGSNDSGERNVISANYRGVAMEDAEVTGNSVAGNFIGTDATGLLDRGNTLHGVYLFDGAHANTIGGSLASQRNVISGNNGSGIEVNGEASDGNILRGNWIGVAASGSSALGNGAHGIHILDGGDNTLVGGTGANDGNWIALPTAGGVFVKGDSIGTVIQGNRIGTDLAGTANWGTGQISILLENGASQTLVGGTTASAGNIVANAGQGGLFQVGIAVIGSNSTGNVFLRNSIYGSFGLGIDLGNDGVTANDAADADSGANDLLNALTLDAAVTNGSMLSVTGSYSGAPNTYYRIDVYSNTSAEPSGTGEGRTWIGSVNVPVGTSGTVSGGYSVAGAVAAGSYISATVTRTDSTYASFYETSEFSNHVVAQTPSSAPAGSDGAVNAVEDTVYTFSTADFGFSDSDGDSLQRVWFDTVPASGSLRWNGTPFAAGNWIDAADITSGLLTYMPASDAQGTALASFTFRVQDDGGTLGGGADTDATANTITINVSAVNDAPLITSNGGGASAAASVAENALLVTTVTSSDADGDTPVYSIAGGADAAHFSINAASGVLTFNTAPDFESATDAGGNNVYDVTVQVSDGNGGTDTQTLAVTVTNANGVAAVAPDVFTGSEDASISGNVLSNDSYIEASALTAVSVSNPANGSLSLNVDGSFTYTPDANFNGSDSFQYLAVDPNAGLSHYWGLEGNGSDALGGANGVVGGSPATIAGSAGAALQFDGVDDHVALPDVSYSNEFSLTFQFMVADNNGSGLQYFYSHGTLPTAALPNTVQVALVENAYSIPGQQNSIVTTVWDANDTSGQVFVDIASLIGDGQWHQYTLTVRSGVGIEVFVDGLSRGTLGTSGDAIDPTGNAYLGARADLDPSRFLNAGSAMDSVALYNRALSAAEVSGLYANPQQATATLNVNPVNDAPALDSSGTMTLTTINEDATANAGQTVASIVASAGGDRITDVDAGSVEGIAIVATTNGNGNWEYSTNGGANWSAVGAVSDTSALLLRDTDLLRFAPDAQNATAGDIGFRAWDQTSGSFGTKVDASANGGITAFSTATETASITVSAVNDAPSITSNGGGAGAAISAAENSALATTVTSSDVDGGAAAYSIVGGADAILFSIDAATGALTFNTAPDFELPADAGGNNVYDVTVQVSDGNGGTDTQAVAVTVTNVNEAPIITSSGTASAAESQTAAITVTSSDVDGGAPSYSVVGGADAALFSIDAATGVLTFNAAPDFEAPADAGSNNVYDVTVMVSDGNGATDTQSIAVTVSGVNEAPAIASNGGGASATVNVVENQTAVTAVVSTDVDGSAPVYSLAGGADAALFTIDGATGVLTFLVAPDFESPGDADGDNVYELTVQVADGNGGFDTQAISVTVGNVNEAPVITSGGGGPSMGITIAENQSAVTVVTSADVDGAAAQYSIVGGADAARFMIDAAAGTLSFVSAPDFEAPSDADLDNVYELTVGVDDGNGGTDMQSIAVSITGVNEAPGNIAPAAAELLENAPAGTVVAMVTASDPDAGDLFTFALVNDGAGRFVVDPSSGRLQVAPGAVFDFQSAPSHSLVLRVTDAQGLRTEQTIVVTLRDVEETPPVIVPPDLTPPPAPPTPGPAPAPVAPAPAVTPVVSNGIEEPLRGGGREPAAAVTPAALRALMEDDPERDARWQSQPGRSTANRSPVLVASVSFGSGDGVGGWSMEALDGLLQPQSEGALQRFGLFALRGSSLETDASESSARAENRGADNELLAALQDPVRVASATLTAGFVWWLTRSGGLLTSILMGIPAWRHVDLLPVLASARDDEDDDGLGGEAPADEGKPSQRDSLIDDLFSNTSRMFGESRYLS